MTAAAENWQRRTRSSTAVGEVPSRSMTCRRAWPGRRRLPWVPPRQAAVRRGPAAVPRANSGSRGRPSREGWSGRLSSTSCGRLGQVRALADQVVGAARARIERRAGHGEQLAAGLLGEPGGDQAAGAQRRLHHHDAEREAGDDPVAAREMACLGRGAEGGLGDHGARFGDAALQIGVLRRVGDVEAAGDRRDGAAGAAARRCAPRRRCRARGRRPPPGRVPRARRPGSRPSRWPLAEALRPPTRATPGAASSGRVAQDGDDRRRVVEQGQQRRIVRASANKSVRAELGEALQSRAPHRRGTEWRAATAALRRGRGRAARRGRLRPSRSGAAGGDRRPGRRPRFGRGADGRAWSASSGRVRGWSCLADRCSARCPRAGGGCSLCGGQKTSTATTNAS